MRSILLAASSAIKRRKTFSVIIAGSVFLASLLLITTFGMMRTIQKPFDTFFNKMNASHILLFNDSNLEAADSIQYWFEQQHEVEFTTPDIPYYQVDKPIIFKGTEIDMMVQLFEHHNIHQKQDKIYVYKGSSQDHPQIGEIWITQNLARDFGIGIGDTLLIPLAEGIHPLKVSATIFDPHYASGLFNPTRAWIAPGGLAFFLPVSNLRSSVLGVRVKSVDEIQSLWKRFNNQWTHNMKILQYGQFKDAYMGFFNILVAVLLIFSTLAFFGACLIIYLTLLRSLSSERKVVGNFKAIGFKPNDVVAYYIIQYWLLLIISMLPSIFLAEMMLELIFTSIGGPAIINNSTTGYLLQSSAFTFLLFTMAIVITVVIGAYKISKSKPVTLLKEEVMNHHSGNLRWLRKWFNTNLSLPFMVGLTWVFSNLRRSIFTGITIILAVFVLVFSINVSYSFAKLKDNREAWGIDNTDVLVKLNPHVAIPIKREQLLSQLSENKEVAYVVPYSYTNALIPEAQNTPTRELLGRVFSEDINNLGLTNLTGTHPIGDDETSLCMLTAIEMNKNVGDQVTLILEGQKKILNVTGIYQDINNMGRGFRIKEETMLILNPLYKPDLFAIKLNDGTDELSFKEELAQIFGETVIIETNVEDRKAIHGTISSIQATMAIFSFFFVSVMILFLVNDITSHLRENKKTFGILKSIGFTPLMINKAMMIRIISITLFCLMVGIPISLFVVPGLVNHLTSGIGLKEFPYACTKLGMVSVFFGILSITLLSNKVLSASLMRISSKELVTE